MGRLVGREQWGEGAHGGKTLLWTSQQVMTLAENKAAEQRRREKSDN